MDGADQGVAYQALRWPEPRSERARPIPPRPYTIAAGVRRRAREPVRSHSSQPSEPAVEKRRAPARKQSTNGFSRTLK